MTAACPVCHAAEVETQRSIRVADFLRELTDLDAASNELRRLVRSTESDIGTDTYTILACRSCGLEFADPMRQPSGHWYAEVYGRYRPGAYRDRWEFDAVASRIEAGQRVLEVGCGDGRFLARAAARGAEAVGVDPNPKAAAAARRQGLTVHATPEEVGGEFDWVCLFHTLEHLPDPRGFLRDVLARCRTGGRLALTVPSRTSYIEFIWGESVLALPPHHMTSWSETSLRVLLSSVGLVEEQLSFEPLPGALFRRRYAESLVRRGALAPLMAVPRAKGLITRLAQALYRSRVQAAAARLTGKSMLAIFARPPVAMGTDRLAGDGARVPSVGLDG